MNRTAVRAHIVKNSSEFGLLFTKCHQILGDFAPGFNRNIDRHVNKISIIYNSSMAAWWTSENELISPAHFTVSGLNWSENHNHFVLLRSNLNLPLDYYHVTFNVKFFISVSQKANKEDSLHHRSVVITEILQKAEGSEIKRKTSIYRLF